MKDFGNIFSFYLRKQLKSKGFWIITLLLAVASSLALVLAGKLSESSDRPIFYLIDRTESLAEAWQDESLLTGLEAYMELDLSMLENSQDREELEKRAEKEGEILLLLEEEDGLSLTVMGDASEDRQGIQLLGSSLSAWMKNQSMEKLGLTPEQKASLEEAEQGIEISYTQEEGDTQAQILTMVLFLIMVLFIILYSNSASGEIAFLKTNRIMEIFTTSVRPVPLYLGINAAYCLGPVLQLGMVMGVVFCVKEAFGIEMQGLMPSQGADFSLLSPGSLALYLLLLVLGYFIYALLNTSLVSVVNRSEDCMGINVPLAYLALIQYFIGIMAASGDSLVLRITSFIPFTSPSLMFLRYVYGYADGCQLLISLGILLLTVYALARLGAGFFTRGIHFYGSLKDYRKSRKQCHEG